MGNKLELPTPIEFANAVNHFKKIAGAEELKHHREISFDICYNYFRRNREHLSDDMQKSCCILWSYLASWGMLRGSSFLLQKNPAYLEELIRYIQEDKLNLFDIDVDKYGADGVIKRITDGYEDIYKLLGGKNEGKGVNCDKGTNPTSTLITKIMLGVFGCVPAYDTYFCETFHSLMPDGDFRYKKVNSVSLAAIYEFYNSLHETIDNLAAECKITDPFNAEAQNGHYSKAKIIDMYGFNVSLTKAEAEARAKAEAAKKQQQATKA